MMRIFYKKNLYEISRWSDDISTLGREHQKAFIVYVLSMFRSCFMQQFSLLKLNHLSQKELTFSAKVYSYIHKKSELKIYKECTSAIHDITSNGNAKIIFFDFALKVSSLISSKPI